MLNIILCDQGPTCLQQYVAKEDLICLLSVAKEATLNEQWIKPGVPFGIGATIWTRQ